MNFSSSKGLVGALRFSSHAQQVKRFCISTPSSLAQRQHFARQKLQTTSARSFTSWHEKQQAGLGPNRGLVRQRHDIGRDARFQSASGRDSGYGEGYGVFADSSASKGWVDVRGPLDFGDFLEADVNRDGRVSAVEWEAYLRKKRQEASADTPGALQFELPLSPVQANELLQNTGLALTINGQRYNLVLEPAGETRELIRQRKQDLVAAEAELAALREKKRPLDLKAAKHCRHVMLGALGYLLLQSFAIARLTFFSRFGWDVMEPITYFITFGTGIVGFVFFQYHKIEYSYPALAALITQRKARKLYQKHGFDYEYYETLKMDVERKKQKLSVLVPPLASERTRSILRE